MAEIKAHGTLVEMIRAAGKNKLPEGWLCLADEETTPGTRCVLLESAADEELEAAARALGYPRESLDTHTLEDVFYSAARLAENPSDDQLVRAFVHYCDHDAFITDIDAPVPPAPTQDEIDDLRRHEDRKFYKSLGRERTLVRCRLDGCRRGAISLSVFCRPHHFESVKGKPSPFDD